MRVYDEKENEYTETGVYAYLVPYDPGGGAAGLPRGRARAKNLMN